MAADRGACKRVLFTGACNPAGYGMTATLVHAGLIGDRGDKVLAAPMFICKRVSASATPHGFLLKVQASASDQGESISPRDFL